MKLYYSHGRTAFKYGLKYLGFKRNDKLMLPNYLCSVLMDPLKHLEIKPVFYEINNDFTINLKDIRKKFNKRIKGILFINFFGFEENLLELYKFCKKKKMFLIEDNCHLLKKNFKYDYKLLDASFYSTRKFIKNSFSGAVLNISNKKYNPNIINAKFEEYPINFYKKLNFFLGNNFPKIKKFLKYFLLKMPNYDIIRGIKDEVINKDFKIDRKSFINLEKFNFKKEKKLRLENYKIWKNFCKKLSLKPIKRSIKSDTIPWLLPIYIKDQKLKLRLFKFGWKNGFNITSWPSLPNILINKKNKNKWKSLICFDTSSAPKNFKYLKF